MEIDSLPNGSGTEATATTGTTLTSTTVTNAATPPPSSQLSQITESLKLEHQFLRVPFEHYKKTIRANHRIVEKEISSVVSGVSVATDSEMSRDDAVNHLNSLFSRLQGLKRKASANRNY